MKKQFLLFGLLIILFSACKKTSFNDSKQATIDDDKIKAYIAANHIDVTKDPATGIYYKILIQGTGPKPTVADTVRITYVGTLLNGTVFQPKSTSTAGVAELIKGFQLALPLMSVDSSSFTRIRLIVPSSLGYGSVAQGGDVPIAANSPLDFTIDLLGFFGPSLK
jgi:FKBP-type peptidyl-prolyl cis-trans isomerase FkpA